MSVRWDSSFIGSGFTQIPNLVLFDPDIPKTALRVYAAFIHYSWQYESEWPGQESIGEALGISVSALGDAIQSLEENGLIETKRRGLGLTNAYTIISCPAKYTDQEGNLRGFAESGFDKNPIPYREKTREEQDVQEFPSETPAITRKHEELDEEFQTALDLDSDDPPLRAVVGSSSSGSAKHRDPIWDGLVKCVGEPTNDNERGKLNKACKLIRQSLEATNAGISYDNAEALVRQRFFKISTVWPGITPTALTLANNWMTLEGSVKAICANEKPGWDDEEKEFVPATKEQLEALKGVVFQSV